MREQRKFIRYEAEGRVTLSPDDGSSRAIETELVDISFAGIGVFSPEKIEPGTSVRFELVTSLAGDRLIGTGQVRYAQGHKKYNTDVFRIGIEFIKLDQKLAQHIINGIQEQICAEARKKERSKRHL